MPRASTWTDTISGILPGTFAVANGVETKAIETATPEETEA
jgi:hypothetical protein